MHIYENGTVGQDMAQIKRYTFKGCAMVAWKSIQTAVDWIEDNLGENISIIYLAEIANLSPYYFQRLFKKMVGKSVMEYVKLRRLARISDSLIFGDNTVLKSCCHYGFENHETFCRSFKGEYGMTPTECRKLAQAVSKFPKPILSEKGSYAMDYHITIEELGEIEYLTIPQFLPLHEGSNADEIAIKFWEQCDKDGSFDRLKSVCGSDTIYALFCNTCDTKTFMTSYDFACINQTGADSTEFCKIRLRAAKYAVFYCAGESPMTIKQAYWRFNDIFWGEWLPKTNYKSVIDYDHRAGSASIELFTPFKPYSNDVSEFSVKVWYPIEDK